MDFYHESGRHDMSWRRPDEHGTFDPYKILVSEVMLQQTQVDRVAPKYTAFLNRFPTVQTLTGATLGDVLKLWNGLGYNRRAKYIWQAAQMLMQDYDGRFPETTEELQKLPGIGPNTAGAIMAYAYDAPVVFVETNIRTVIIHHFFEDQASVPDTKIREILDALIPKSAHKDRGCGEGTIFGPREFYWAMMDYGSYLKKTVGNIARASKHYTKQSKFHGSKRQVRGQVLRLLVEKPLTLTALKKRIDDERLEEVVAALESEGFITKKGRAFRLS
jgi:A/G-specific adenine glycosylase